jgi:hypothetical protein
MTNLSYLSFLYTSLSLLHPVPLESFLAYLYPGLTVGIFCTTALKDIKGKDINSGIILLEYHSVEIPKPHLRIWGKEINFDGVFQGKSLQYC